MPVFEEAQIWDDNPQPVSGSTAFGFYDNDSQFQSDALNFARWAARRLGYPVVEIEMVDYEFYECFEEAVSEFANQVNQFNIRENRLAVHGMSTDINLTQKAVVNPGVAQVVRLAKAYGAEAGAGGNVTWHSGSVQVTSGRQDYDLKDWAATNEPGKTIEVKRIFHEGRPAISRYYDPFVETGIARNNLMDEFGWGGWQPAIEYVLFPIYEDLLRVQSVELNDQIRRSAYSFEIQNNVVRLFPIPTSSYKLWFQYIIVEERDAVVVQGTTGSMSEESAQMTSSKVQGDYSNINYQEIPYNTINQPGKFWVRKYALACAKETLGNTRAKYQQIPIPNAEVTLDGDTLRSEAQQEKELLLTQLRETLEDASMASQWEKKQAQEDAMSNILKNIPSPQGIWVA